MTVLDLQRLLTALGFSPGPADGRLGPRTKAAIIAFQDRLGLVPDGIAGPQTRAALARTAAPLKPGRPEPDKSAIAGPVPAANVHSAIRSAAPPNDVRLLDTSRRVVEIIWHCAATPEGRDYTVADVRAWHKARGWSDIGYHYVVYRDGRVMPGRPVGQIGAHVEGRNVGTIGCCYIGGLTADGRVAKDTRTPAQARSMLWLTERLIAKFPAIAKISGHNDYTAAKACPSFKVGNDPLGKLL